MSGLRLASKVCFQSEHATGRNILKSNPSYYDKPQLNALTKAARKERNNGRYT